MKGFLPSIFLLLVAAICTNILSDQPSKLSASGSLTCGPPSYNCSYDGTDPKPQCTNCILPNVPDMSAEPNAVSYDKTFGLSSSGNQIVRCTYPDINGKNNLSYGIGFGGSGDTNAVGKGGGSPLSYRLIVSDSAGWDYPFTYTPEMLIWNTIPQNIRDCSNPSFKGRLMLCTVRAFLAEDLTASFISGIQWATGS